MDLEKKKGTMVYDRLLIRHGLYKDMPIRARVGEILYCEDTNQIFIGQGDDKAPKPLVKNNQSEVLGMFFTVETYSEMLSLGSVQQLYPGALCYVGEKGIYYKYVNSKWVVNSAFAIQSEAPSDTGLIWFNPSGTPVKDFVPSDITVEELVSNIKVLVAQIDQLKARVKYLEDNGVSPSEPVSDGMLLETGECILLEDGVTFIVLESYAPPTQ